jgi:hypothetical protein
MPCYRCGVRQVDPGRGPSPWKRGVRSAEQVLVCPECQRDGTWLADLDTCSECGSTMLVRRLGETVCRGCGWVAAADVGSAPAGQSVDDADASRLARDVTSALERLFRPPSGSGP